MISYRSLWLLLSFTILLYTSEISASKEEGYMFRRNNHTEKLPSGVNKYKGEFEQSYATSAIGMPSRGGVITGRPHHNTFKVSASHEKLTGATKGVKFNVETVPDALDQDVEKAKLSWENAMMSAKEEVAAFYDDMNAGFQPKDIRLEAAAEQPDYLVFAGGQGFFYASVTAFAQHLPLALGPDHIWSVLTYAFAKHVDDNAEALRKRFVSHEGKKRLEVRADHMIMSGGDCNSGSSPQVWETTIFPEFSKQIKEHLGDKIHCAIASEFSTTTPAARAAHEITLMSAMKNYFSYGFSTLCGIPSITLLGTEEDWVSLRARTEELGKLMMPDFANRWMPALLPVLDEFVESYKGNVNYGFWQSFVKLRATGGGSGSFDFISGWLQIFFPYLKSGEVNENLKPWQEAYFSGPEPEAFPAIVSSAPVDWDYYGVKYNLHFHAGISGCSQDPRDGTLTPTVGWHVSHDPPQDPGARLRVVKAEIEALLKGHEQEARARAKSLQKCDSDSDWYRRVHILHLEQISLERPSAIAPLKRQMAELEKQSDWDKMYDLERKIQDIVNKEPDAGRSTTTDEMIEAFFEE